MPSTASISARGSIVLPKDFLGSDLDVLRRRLTLRTIPYKNFASQRVEVFEETETSLAVPRYFQADRFWPLVERWDWVTPALHHKFSALMTLDPSRGQPAAVDALERHLRRHSGGVFIAPTGTGKTLCALETARRFQTPIGVLFHAGHMVENWVRHCDEHLGLKDVGFVQEGLCDVGKPVTLMSIQSLLSRRYPDQLYESIGFIIGDEAHRHGSPQWHQTLSLFPARYRLGVSADPNRTDGLKEVVYWTFGPVAYRLRRQSRTKALVCFYRYPASYPEKAYHDFAPDGDGRWSQADPNPVKYDKVLMGDIKRNKWLVEQIATARRKGRCILVFSKRRSHCQALYDLFKREVARDPALQGTNAALLLGGAQTKRAQQANAAALSADVIFSTYGYAKDAMDAVQLDTLFFATPPGNPLQPVGRLRDINANEKQPLLVIDVYEPNAYSTSRAERRETLYRSLGHPIRRFGHGTSTQDREGKR